jgi:hypothetical protein
LLDGLEVDPQIRADQADHSVDVNQNRYIKDPVERRRQAVNSWEQRLGVI